MSEIHTDKLQTILKNSNIESKINFAWVSSLNLLPFMNIDNDFACFDPTNKQNHLQAIFNAIDISAVNDEKYDTNCDDILNALAACVAVSASTDIIIITAITSLVLITSTRKINTDYISISKAFDNLLLSILQIIKKHKNGKLIEKIIIANMRSITNTVHEPFILFDDIEFTNKFNEFIQILNKVGCKYWADLYQNLYNNKYAFDVDELYRRLSVPNEIKSLGASAVGEYMCRINENALFLNETRIIILGEKGVGKTSLARKLLNINANMPDASESTEGVTVSLWTLPGKEDENMNVYIWDFAGHAITHSVHRCFMSSRCLYIYVYDGRIEHNNRTEYWLEQIRIFSGDSPVLFLINQRDENVPEVEKKSLKIDYPNILSFHTVNIASRDATEFDSFRKFVMDTVRQNPSWSRTKIPANTYRIKNALLENFYGTKVDYITRKEFNELALSYNTNQNEINNILMDLHSLGICFWYGEDLMKPYKTLILNPEWITGGIYRIINWGNNNKRYILSLKDSYEIFSSTDLLLRYPQDKVKFLFKIMSAYELAFDIVSNEEGYSEQIFIPLLLPLDRPDELPDFSKDDYLKMIFSVDRTLPPNIVSRLIVRRNNEYNGKNELWRKGAVLHYRNGNAVARIIEDIRIIEVIVTGEDKTDYLKKLRESLIDIFESYKQLSPKLEYEVLFAQSIMTKDDNHSFKENKSPLMLTDDTIIDFLQRDIPYPYGQQDFSLQSTAIGYSINYTSNNQSSHIANNNYIFKIQSLQGEMRNLIKMLKKVESKDDFNDICEIIGVLEDAEEIYNTSCNLKEAEQTIRKNGILANIKHFYNDLMDEESYLNQHIIKLQYGAKKLHNILCAYNEFAKLISSLPQVPITLLNQK
jgi:GTPase SAR1 family protein